MAASCWWSIWSEGHDCVERSCILRQQMDGGLVLQPPHPMAVCSAPVTHSNVADLSPKPSGQVIRHSTTGRPSRSLPLATNTLTHTKHSTALDPKHSLHSGLHSEHKVPFCSPAVPFSRVCSAPVLKVPVRHSCKATGNGRVNRKRTTLRAPRPRNNQDQCTHLRRIRCREVSCYAESRDCERYGRQGSHTGEWHIHITLRKSRDHLSAPLRPVAGSAVGPSLYAATDGLSQLTFPSSSTRKMRLRLTLGCALVVACAAVASGITEIELERVTEPAVIIASHVYRGGWGLAPGGGRCHAVRVCSLGRCYVHATVHFSTSVCKSTHQRV